MSQECTLDAAQARKVMLLAFGTTSSMALGISSVMPMIPMLAKTFAVSQSTASLVITVFTLPGVIFALLSGVLADRFGRRAVLAPSLFVFSLAGAGIALALLLTVLAVRFLPRKKGAGE